ncbi:hypothetical protein NBRC116592_04790 [Colwellia sp. KU-HH00111]
MCLAEADSQESATMKIHLSKQTFYLGEDILVDIYYPNLRTSVITIPDPETSFDVEMHFLDINTEEDLNYTMGQSTTTVMENASDQWALNVPVPEEISIAPNDVYHFTSNANERLYLNAGKYVVYVTDSESESARLEVSIVLNKDALTHLSALAMNTKENYSRREWAMTHVQTVYPKFILLLPDEGISKAAASENEKNNQIQYQSFMKWLESGQVDIP